MAKLHPVRTVRPRAETGAGLAPKPAKKSGVVSGQREFRQTHRMVNVATELDTADAINTALQKSGYPLQGVICHWAGSSLLLDGDARCYYHIQVALTIAMKVARGRRVVCIVNVVPLQYATCEN